MYVAAAIKAEIGFATFTQKKDNEQNKLKEESR